MIIKAENKYWQEIAGVWREIPESAISYGMFSERLSAERVDEIRAIIRSLPVPKTGDFFGDLFAMPTKEAKRAAIGPDYDVFCEFASFDGATADCNQT